MPCSVLRPCISVNDKRSIRNVIYLEFVLISVGVDSTKTNVVLDDDDEDVSRFVGAGSTIVGVATCVEVLLSLVTGNGTSGMNCRRTSS